MKITKELVVPNYGIEGTQGSDGKPAIYTTVTNQNIVLNAPYQGLPSDYSNANGSIQVFEGDKEVTQQATYTLKQTLNVAATLDFNKFKVTHVSTDNGMFIVTVKYKEVVSDIMITTHVVRNGQSGQDGPPTGIIESPTIPTDVYQGMLWKNTGNLSGFITDVTYIYRGSKWEKYIFTAENIVANSLSALSANLGNITAGNIKGVDIEGVNILGSTVETRASKVYPDLGAILYWSKLTDALRISGSSGQGRPTYETTYQLDGMSGFGSGPTGAGKDSEWYFGLNGLSYKSGGVTGIGKVSYDFTSRGFNIDTGNFKVNDGELSTNGPTKLSPASGFSVYSTSEENIPQARRFGKTVTLSGAFTNNNNIAKGWSGVIGYLPGWATPSITHRAFCQGSGSNTFYLFAKSNGELFLERYGTTDTVAFNSGAWLTINTTYLV